MSDFVRIARRISRECPALRSREVSRLLSRNYDAALRQLDIQFSQLSVLVAVAMFGEGGARIGPLADRLIMDRTTLTRNIRPVEKAGLLRVSRSPDDARVRVVTLTRAGERTIEKAYPLWEEAQRRAYQKFGAKRVEALCAHIDELIGVAPNLVEDKDAGV